MKRMTAALLLFVLILSVFPSAFAQKGGILRGNTLSKQPRPPARYFQVPSITISEPEAFSDGNGAIIRWKTESETGNLGFYVYRVDKDGNTKVGNFVGGSAAHFGAETVSDQEYSSFD